ncbi:hypothetical protein J7M28_06080 [bacterium]|nr:hypothetical protein [bacterium]
MTELLYIACTIAIAIASGTWLAGYWLALDAPRVKLVSHYLPIIFIHAAALLLILKAIGLRKGLLRATKSLCAISALSLIAFATPLFTSASRYFEALAGTGILLVTVSVGVVLILLLFRNMSDLSQKGVLVLLVAICASVYFWFGLWLFELHPPDGDEPYYLLIAHSIAYDHDIDSTNNFENKDYREYYPYELQPQYRSIEIMGKKYAVPNHNIGLPVLIAPAYWLFGHRGAYALMNLLAALLIANVFLLSSELGASRKHALIGSLLFGFSVPMLNYANQVFPATAAALIVLYAVRRLMRTSYDRKKELLIIVALSFALFMLKLRLSVIAGPLLILSLWQTSKRRVVWLYAGCGMGAVAIGAWLLRDRFVTLRLLTSRLDELFRMGASDFSPIHGILGQMLDQQFGLLVLSPLYLLAIAGVFVLLKSNRPAFFKLLFVAAPYYLVIGSVPWWNASWCPPCRFLIVILPLLGAMLGLGLSRLRTVRQMSVFFFTAAISATFTFLHLLSPVFRYDLANGANRAFWLLNINTHIDLSRFLPSFFRFDLTTPLRVIGEVIALSILFGLLFYRRKKAASQPGDSFETRSIYAAGLGIVAMLFLLAGGCFLDMFSPKSTFELEDEPLSIYDPPSRAFIKTGRRLTPGFPFERDVHIEAGNKLIVIDAMMRNPIWTTVPNIKLELESDEETIPVIDDPVDVELMQKYYRRVFVKGGDYKMRLWLELPGQDIKQVHPDKVANVYVDRVQILSAGGLYQLLYRIYGRLYLPFNKPTGLEYMGHAYLIEPNRKYLGEALLRSFIEAGAWSYASDLYAFRAHDDPLDLSPYSEEARIEIARSELSKGHAENALLVADLVRDDPILSFAARLIEVRAHLLQNDVEAARAVLRRLEEASARPPDLTLQAKYLWAQCLVAKGDESASFNVLRRIAYLKFHDQFDALCNLYSLALKFGDRAEMNRAVEMILKLRTEAVGVAEMKKSEGRQVEGGWVLERNGELESPVNVLSDTLAIRMRVKGKGTFETHVETGLVLDPTTGFARYIMPHIKVQLGDDKVQFVNIPYHDWTNTYIFFDGIEPGAQTLKIEYINDHTFQKDEQNRQFFLSKIWLQSALTFRRGAMNWQMETEEKGLAIFKTEIQPKFPVNRLMITLGELPDGDSATASLLIDGSEICSLDLTPGATGLFECPLDIGPGAYDATLKLKVPADNAASIEEFASGIAIVGFSY